MKRIRTMAVAALIPLGTGGCATADGGQPNFMESVLQGLGAAAMVVGSVYGDQNLAQQGAEAFDRGRRQDSAR